MSLPILLYWLPRRTKQWIAAAMALLMLLAPPVRDWVIDRQVSFLERKLERIMEHMENAPIYGAPMSE
jgi:hypothetical protein